MSSTSIDEDEGYLADSEELQALENYLNSFNLDKRARKGCIERGRCNRRENDCCENRVCKCNLFMQNCRCERKGLFGWGK